MLLIWTHRTVLIIQLNFSAKNNKKKKKNSFLYCFLYFCLCNLCVLVFVPGDMKDDNRQKTVREHAWLFLCPDICRTQFRYSSMHDRWPLTNVLLPWFACASVCLRGKGHDLGGVCDLGCVCVRERVFWVCSVHPGSVSTRLFFLLWRYYSDQDIWYNTKPFSPKLLFFSLSNDNLTVLYYRCMYSIYMWIYLIPLLTFTYTFYIKMCIAWKIFFNCVKDAFLFLPLSVCTVFVEITGL